MKEKTKSGGYGALLSAVSEKKEIIVKSVVFAFAACLFGRAELLFETSPLGLTFVCAVREGIPFASLGLALGALFADPLKTASTLSGLAVSLSFRYALSYVLRRSKGSLLSLNDGLAEKIALKLKPDDTVVMVSDGVTGQTEDTESIVATLRSAAGASPETVCDAVLENAKTAHGLRDDMTVMAVKIKRIKN